LCVRVASCVEDAVWLGAVAVSPCHWSPARASFCCLAQLRCPLVRSPVLVSARSFRGVCCAPISDPNVHAEVCSLRRRARVCVITRAVLLPSMCVTHSLPLSPPPRLQLPIICVVKSRVSMSSVSAHCRRCVSCFLVLSRRSSLVWCSALYLLRSLACLVSSVSHLQPVGSNPVAWVLAAPSELAPV